MNLDFVRARCKASNPVAWVMLQNALDGDIIDTSQACVPRWIIKAVEDETVAEVVSFCRNELNGALGLATASLPIIELDINYNSTVIAYGLLGKRPHLLVEHGNRIVTCCGDFISRATGATWQLPKMLPGVRERVYAGESNNITIMGYLQRTGVAQAGQIIPGMQLVIMGMKLHAFDRMTMLLQALPIWDLHSRHGRQRLVINPQKCEPYQGAVIFLSRGSSTMPAPRLGFGTELVDFYAPEDDLRTLNSKHVHAAFLSGNMLALPILLGIAEAFVAAKMRKLPNDLIHRQDFKRQIRDFLRDIEQDQDPSFTGSIETIEMRRDVSRILSGIGFNSKEFDRQFEEEFPITRRGLSPSAIDNAWSYNATDPSYVGSASNAAHVQALDIIFKFVAASPADVWAAVAQTVEAGVALVQCGTVSDVQVVNDHRIELEGQQVDAMFISPIICGTADPSLSSLGGQVKEIAPGVPALGPYRVLQMPDGRWAPQYDYSLSGEGFRTSDNRMPAVGIQFMDTTSHASACERASGKTDMLSKLSILKTMTSEPLAVLQRIHEASYPSHAGYNAEMVRFEWYWQDLIEAYRYIRISERSASNPEQFAQPMCIAFDSNRRSLMLENMEQAAFQDAGPGFASYDDSAGLGKLQHYRPIGLQRFKEIIVDPRREQMDKVYQIILGAAGIDDAK